MTMIAEYALQAKDVHATTVSRLHTHLSLETEGWRCDTHQTLSLLVKAAATRSSLEGTWQDSDGVAHSNSIREQLNATLDVADLRQHEAEMNVALASAIPKDMWRGGLEVAIDLHDEPFYGKGLALRTYTCRAQAKAGTTHFFRIASAYVIWREVRLTLALIYVLLEDDLVAVVERLLQRLKGLGIHKTVLYMDKGFCTGDILRYLQTVGQSALLACPIRGKQGGIKALCHGRRSYTTAYTFTDGTTVTLAMVATLVPDKSGVKRRKWLAFVLVGLSWTPQQVYDKYRRRFGIECSYRLLRQARARTNSSNPALRFFLLGLALLLQNVWVWVRWTFLRRPGKGRYKLMVKSLRFELFCKLLVRGVERFYPPPDHIMVFVSPDFVIYCVYLNVVVPPILLL